MSDDSREGEVVAFAATVWKWPAGCVRARVKRTLRLLRGRRDVPGDVAVDGALKPGPARDAIAIDAAPGDLPAEVS
jgi:hypothetical protein